MNELFEGKNDSVKKWKTLIGLKTNNQHWQKQKNNKY